MKFVSRLLAAKAIQIRGGSAQCVKGKMVSCMLREISSLASDVNLQEGEIWIDQLGNLSFSREIPEAIRQRIKNVIASH